MADIKVDSAVSAVIAAFHAGAELVGSLRRRKTKRRTQKQSLEEENLHKSLQLGQRQISEHYAAKLQELTSEFGEEFGLRFRNGDGMFVLASRYYSFSCFRALIWDKKQLLAILSSLILYLTQKPMHTHANSFGSFLGLFRNRAQESHAYSRDHAGRAHSQSTNC